MALKDLITWNRRKQQPALSGLQHPVATLQREVDRLFDDFFRGFDRFPSLPLKEERFAEFSPKIDVSENDKEIEIIAEVPGMDQNDVEITLRDDVLTIKGEKKQEKEEKDKEYYHVERSYGSFYRSLQLPCEVDQEKVKASFKKGVLKINLPKSGKAQENVRKIEIKGE
ncbi:small heat shock protein C2 [Candidatus Kuenenia stuttgartiensis]|jgi:HSP20 family protein|uniref:Small heat shock protein C2 n=1 Tax=Kuenenia stuttgartiensis TaxID=174633 RepID=Q1Q416_KUEST|nr:MULTISPECIES: Hsp20/alpha crystallin family protein [Kuenenia]MBE7549383.1 Hsp20/alpha crystallin family protein [Planctomycetia bacterium]MBZ0191223.1 Hsp20/alpha crystallin family protein [Candidatus Kuenenia stuttgartiensis]MCL4727989.1 Hsp20/alpha crystallin family protein [Candidatus Kuenenia stuttgartiensis]MCZ7623280.1 Hsp20/alpha crystallin family protein [Candidatus Kuenenia sp.]QII11868.1 small heat shock protein C2 [Candidatus Kuenenia stuttgartiensis]